MEGRRRRGRKAGRQTRGWKKKALGTERERERETAAGWRKAGDLKKKETARQT